MTTLKNLWWWLLFWGAFLVVITGAAVLPGCIQLYPRWMDTPAGQAAMIEAFREGAKTVSGKAHIYNPRIEVYQKMAFGISLDGVGTDMQYSGTSAGVATQPAPVLPTTQPTPVIVAPAPVPVPETTQPAEIPK